MEHVSVRSFRKKPLPPKWSLVKAHGNKWAKKIKNKKKKKRGEEKAKGKSRGMIFSFVSSFYKVICLFALFFILSVYYHLAGAHYLHLGNWFILLLGYEMRILQLLKFYALRMERDKIGNPDFPEETSHQFFKRDSKFSMKNKINKRINSVIENC